MEQVCNRTSIFSIQWFLFVSHNVKTAANIIFAVSELQGIDRTILMRALKLLENKGKLALFKGTSADDEGVKFSV